MAGEARFELFIVMKDTRLLTLQCEQYKDMDTKLYVLQGDEEGYIIPFSSIDYIEVRNVRTKATD